jgi:hypothetical protein
MARKHAERKGKPPAAPPPPPEAINNAAPPSSDDVQAGDFSLHALFQQKAMKLLDRADMTEEQKQSILVAMSCPCCGAGGLSYTVKLKRKK